MSDLGKITLSLLALFVLNLALQKGIANHARHRGIIDRINAQSNISILGSIAAWTLIAAAACGIAWLWRS